VSDDFEQLQMLGRFRHDVPVQRFCVVANVATIRRLLIPVQLAVIEVLRFCFPGEESRQSLIFPQSSINSPRHPTRQRSENPLHHRQMLAVVVRLEERDPKVQLEHDAADGP
jgi:hypothetical protein